MRIMYYLDAANERASDHILNCLGLTFGGDKIDGQQNITIECNNEHKLSTAATISLLKGNLALDIRDSSNCWIRIHLEAGDYLRIPADIYRKLVWDQGADFDYASANNAVISKRYTEIVDSISPIQYHQYRELVCELCRNFFDAGWVTGTGGSISIRHGNRIYMTPSGVQKERINPNELFVLDTAGNVLCVPEKKPDFLTPKLSDCAPLFLHAYQQRNAGAVLHSHAYSANLVTSIFEGKAEFRISHQEMIKGIRGYGYFDELVIPIIENTAWEHELADMLGATIAAYPKAVAVLVRRHGMYVWGATWEEAKRHGECLHYLFEVVIRMQQLGLDYTRPPITATDLPASKKVKRGFTNVIFDIEGTTTPISFVKDVLFPYAVQNVQSFLEKYWKTVETQNDVNQLMSQSEADIDASVGSPRIIQSDNTAEYIDSIVNYVKWNIENDRKISSLKQLQGRIWDIGYNSGNLKSVVYDDVPRAFEKLRKDGLQVSIYSSGSRGAQRSLFKYSNHGDLRNFISVYFDTKIGGKREISSYLEIIQYLGVDSPSDILFVTDVYEEAVAADGAGIDVAISVRPGNLPLPENCKFRVIQNFDQL